MIQTLVISNSQFKNNEAGPQLDKTFIESEINPTASQIFIKGGLNNSINSCKFLENKGSGDHFLPSILSSGLTKFFPKEYFLKSHSSQIVIAIDPKITKNFAFMNTTIYKS